jgi:glutathione S-transferase
MGLTIHGSARSRTMRVLWMAEELGLAYDHDPIAFDDPRLKSPAFVRLNPAGAIPTIEDDGFALAESLAINLYLAKKHSLGGLYPATLEGEAQAWRWSLWAQGELEPWVMRETRETASANAELARPAIAAGLNTLERALDGRAWLVGGTFTVADFNVACVLSPSRSSQLDLTPYRRVSDWLTRCYARPAGLVVRKRHGAWRLRFFPVRASLVGGTNGLLFAFCS